MFLKIFACMTRQQTRPELPGVGEGAAFSVYHEKLNAQFKKLAVKLLLQIPAFLVERFFSTTSSGNSAKRQHLM